MECQIYWKAADTYATLAAELLHCLKNDEMLKKIIHYIIQDFSPCHMSFLVIFLSSGFDVSFPVCCWSPDLLPFP